MSTMKALEFNPENRTLTIVDKSIRTPSENEVLVKVYYSGICGTDLHICEGHFFCKKSRFIPGHEFSGVVAKIGSNVSHVKVDDRVAVNPNRPCHVCNFCCTGRYNLCKTAAIYVSLGIFEDGGWAEYCIVPEPQVFHLSDSITLKQAVFTEPLSCVYHGLNRLGTIAFGDRILIQGAGIIGNLWSAMLHHMGHRNVTVSEPSKTRRAIFQRLGTSFRCVHPDDLVDVEADIIIECSGSAQAVERAVNLLSPGGRLCIFGVASPDAIARVSPFEIYEKEITIVGVKINKFAIPGALGLIESMDPKLLDYHNLGVKVYDIHNYKTAFEDLKMGTISKAVFQINY